MTHVIQSGNWREARYTVWDWRGARDVVIQSGNWRARDTVIHEPTSLPATWSRHPVCTSAFDLSLKKQHFKIKNVKIG